VVEEHERYSLRTISDLNHQGQTMSSLAEKVKAFHAYFLSVFTREDTRNLESSSVNTITPFISAWVQEWSFMPNPAPGDSASVG